MNYYSDIPELKFHLSHPLMKRIVELREKGFADKDTFAEAPSDYDEAVENYDLVMEIAGDIAANIIEPNSESVDMEGPHLVEGRMVYAEKTFGNLEAMNKAGLNGVSMPRRYGGLNFPIVSFTMLSEIVAAADAGFQNIFGVIYGVKSDRVVLFQEVRASGKDKYRCECRYDCFRCFHSLFLH